MMGDIMMLVETLRENLHNVESEISFIKKMVASSVQNADVSYKVKVLEPKFFGGARSVKELNFFLGYRAILNSGGECGWVVRHVH